MKNTTPTSAETTPSTRLQARIKAARTKRLRRYAADILLAGHLVIAFMLGAWGAVDQALIVLTALPVCLIAHVWAYRPLACRLNDLQGVRIEFVRPTSQSQEVTHG